VKDEGPRRGPRTTGQGLGDRSTAPPHEVEMRILGSRLRWLESREEHWWQRSLRWHREVFSPDCECRSCRWAA
jgi:hypothetical protein